MCAFIINSEAAIKKKKFHPRTFSVETKELKKCILGSLFSAVMQPRTKNSHLIPWDIFDDRVCDDNGEKEANLNFYEVKKITEREKTKINWRKFITMVNFVSWEEFLEVFHVTEEVKTLKRGLEGELVIIDERSIIICLKFLKIY